MKSFLQYIDDNTLDFYMENVEGYSDFIEYQKGDKELPNSLVEKIQKFSKSELHLLEDKLIFKYLNHINWEVDSINEDIIKKATDWELETLKNG